jgi:hypothetical protein
MKKFLYLIFGLGLFAPVALTAMQNDKYDQKTCTICFNEFADQRAIQESGKLIKTKCGHIFHEKCLNNWLKKKNNCPLCKKTDPIVIVQGVFNKIKSTAVKIFKNKTIATSLVLGLNILTIINLDNNSHSNNPLENKLLIIDFVLSAACFIYHYGEEYARGQMRIYQNMQQ